MGVLSVNFEHNGGKMKKVKLVFLDIGGIFCDYLKEEYIPKELVKESLAPYIENNYKFYWITNRGIYEREYILDRYNLHKYIYSYFAPDSLNLNKFDFFRYVLYLHFPQDMSFDEMVLKSDFHIFDDMPHHYIYPSWRHLSNLESIRKIYQRLHTYLHPKFAMNRDKNIFWYKILMKKWEKYMILKNKEV